MFAALTSVMMLLSAGPQVASDPRTTEAVGTGPQPAPRAISWELEFRFLDPRRITVQLPGTDAPETFWYMVYTAVNPSPRSQHFFPQFQIVTEDLRVYDSDVGIHPLVFDAIRERHRITHPYLVPPSRAIGALLSGDDNARESTAIWRQADLDVNSFGVYVSGLSGETRFVSNPNYTVDAAGTVTVIGPDGRPREIDLNPRYFILRKTLEIRYTLPGSPQSRPGAAPQRDEVRWIMR